MRISVGAIIVVLPLVVWIINFYKSSISGQTNNWADFGSYVGGVISAIAIPITLFYVLKTFQSQQELEKASKFSLLKSEFDNRWFELLRSLNDFRFNHLTCWEETGNKLETRQYHTGLKWFIYQRRKYQLKYEELLTIHNMDESHTKAYEYVLSANNLNFEYFFRSITGLILVANNFNNTAKSFPGNLQVNKDYISLLSTILTNDELFFIKYYEDYPEFRGKFELLKSCIPDLSKNLFFDYKIKQD